MKTYAIEVTGPELQLIGKALGTAPYSQVVSLINKIEAQVNAQNVPAQSYEDAAPGK